MAKVSKSTAFKGAVINKEDMTITEFTKDDSRTYSLDKLLDEWNGIEGISLTIKQDDEIPADNE